ncbi:GNAT family N-acetyltransferase [Chlorogloeopsis sp. ULAP02]|uniref:GNAT family N-acetyltransferase n=1 Tax=Chlorogloeopsis sp. ULAP02 TaxID=3107926 RepID=UPI0031369391
MKLHHFEDASLFYNLVKEYLLNQEALHNLQLGIANTLIHHPEVYKSQPYLATVEAGGDIVAVAMRTPPHVLLLSQIKDGRAVEMIAQDLYLSSRSLPGVNAPTAEAQAFAEKWRSLSGQSYKLKMATRAFQLEKVNFVSTAKGYLRLARESDRELLKNWCEAFWLEIGESINSNSEQWVERSLRQGNIYLWENEMSVSMACSGQPTPNGVRIGLVYTPLQYRRQGYASACVATLSQTLLNQGHKYCFLFTDLANPTSNHIYQAIGYQPVGDWNNYSFVEKA